MKLEKNFSKKLERQKKKIPSSIKTLRTHCRSGLKKFSLQNMLT